MGKVLQNNLKPATHFIEVIAGTYQIWQEKVKPLVDLRICLAATRDTKLNTIAIFKIRAK